MQHRRFRPPTTIKVATAVAVGLMAITPASEAATPRVLPSAIDALPRGGALDFGSGTLTLSGGASGKLSASGAKLSGAGTLKVKGRTISFDVAEAGTLFDPTAMVGAFVLDGSLTAKGKAGTARLTKLTLEAGTGKRFTAKIGSKKPIQLGTFTGGKASFSGLALGKLSAAKLSLSSGGAKALNAATGGGFGAGPLGTVALEAATREYPIRSGTASMALNTGFLKTLTDQGFAITATAPATREGDVISIAMTSGTFDPINLTGRLSMEGKITLTKGDRALDLFGFKAVIGDTQKELFASINTAVGAAIANLDVSGLVCEVDSGNFTGTGAKVGLSKISVAILKQQFGIDVPAGTELGTVKLAGELAGK